MVERFNKTILSALSLVLAFFFSSVEVAAAAVPAKPSNVSVSAVADGGTLLRWRDRSSNESSFKIERAKLNTSTNRYEVAPLFSVGANVTQLLTYPKSPGKFRFRVRACNSSGCSGWTSAVYLTLAVPTATPTATATAVATSGNQSSNTPTPTPQPTATLTPTATPTYTPTSLPTQSPQPTPTRTPTSTPTATRTATPSPTPTRTATATPTRTATPTPIRTPTSTPTGTPAATTTPTPTSTPTAAGASQTSECTDGIDNDGDGMTDMADAGGAGAALGCSGPNGQETAIAKGYTLYSPSSDSRIVYVSSSSGSDGNDGLSATSPKQTLAAAYSLLRSNFPDWMLLKRGDVWNGSFPNWAKSGRSNSERMLIASYGTSTARPEIRSGSTTGLIQGTNTLYNLAFAGIFFNANTWTGGSYDGPNGMEIVLQAGGNISLEDMYFKHYGTQLVIQGYGSSNITNVSVVRSMFEDGIRTNRCTAQIFTDGIRDQVFRENNIVNFRANDILDNNAGTCQSHAIYLAVDVSDVGRSEMHGNIAYNHRSNFTNRPSGPLQFNNLSIRAGIAFSTNEAGYSPTPMRFIGNVVTETRDRQDGPNGAGYQPLGGHVWFGGNANGSEVAYNILTHATDGGDPRGFFMWSYNDATSIHHNIGYDWFSVDNPTWGSFVVFADTPRGQMTMYNNDFQNPGVNNPAISNYANQAFGSWLQASNNRYYNGSNNIVDGPYYTFSQWKSQIEPSAQWTQVVYPNPQRTVGSYNQSIGGTATTEGFLREALKQSRFNWRTQLTAGAVNDYIRAGFGMTLPPAQ